MRTHNLIYRDEESLKKFVELNGLQLHKSILVQIFSGIVDKEKLLGVSGAVKKTLPLANIIGTTTAGEIYAGKMYEEHIIISFLVFESSVVKTELFDFDKNHDIDKMLNSLITRDTKVLILFSDGLKSNAEDLIHQISSLRDDLVIAGGRAADLIKFEQTFVFDDKRCTDNGCVIASLSGDDLLVNSDYMLDWNPVGKEMLVTKSKNNQLFELDGMKIVDVYRKYLGEDIADNLPLSGNEFPLLINKGSTEVARVPIARLEDDSLLYGGYIDEGDIAQFSFGNIEHIKNSTDENFTKFKNIPAEAIYIYSCSARKTLMGKELENEFSVLEALAPTAGFFTYGEYFHSQTSNKLLNVTTTFLSLSESSQIGEREFKKNSVNDKNRILTAMTHLTAITSQELEESKNDIKLLNVQLEVQLELKTKDLKVQKELLENVINSTEDAIFYKDINFNYLGCNKGFEKFARVPVGNIVGKDDYELFPKEYADIFRNVDRELLKSEKTITDAEWMTYPDGIRIYWLATLSVLRNNHGEIYGLVGVAKDITKEYQLEKEKDEAVSALKAKSEFLANMSHEIRTPLNAILGFVDIVKESEISAENKKYLSVVQSSGGHLMSIINDILDFSKIDSNHLELELVKIDPFEKFTHLSELFSPKAKEKNIDLKMIIDSNLSKCIEIDPLRMSQVVSNLLSNAIKFTPKNGSVILKIDYIKEIDSMLVSVKDTGIGVSEDKQKHIFEAFTQADSSTTREYGGTGLGLAISHKLIALMGSTLKLRSKLGEGSEFYFTLALPKCDSCFIPTIKMQELKPIEKEEGFEGKKILLVEDNKANQMFMKVILKKLKLEFDIANDGVEAVEIFKKGQYDAILMDENMPNKNGIAATKEILAYEKKNNLIHTPIIALTANAIKGDRERFLAAGMDEYLTKPVNKAKLIEILKIFLQK